MKLSTSQKMVAGIAASGYGPINAARLVRKVMWTGVRVFILVAASQQTDSWLSVALVTMATLTALPLLFIGLAQRGLEERVARLALLSESARVVLRDKTRLYGKAAA